MRRPGMLGLGLLVALGVGTAARGQAGPPKESGPTAVEADVVRRAEADVPDALRLLETLVNIPSATQNLAGVRAVGRAFEGRFAAIGFAPRWADLPPSMKRAGHLVAEHAGTKGRRLLLIGHLDTVLEGRKFERRGRRAFGTGTVDMKGGDVIVLYALKALHDAGRLADRRIAVIFTGDEESVGEPIAESRAAMVELARRSDLALAFEAVIDDTATVARRGVATWTLRVEGRTGHSSGVFGRSLGDGAVFEAARVLDEFRRELKPEKARGLTINPSLIVGGTGIVAPPTESEPGSAHGKSNVVAAEVLVRGDLRYLSDAQRREGEAAMRAALRRSLLHTRSTLEVVPEYPAMAPTPGNYATLATLDRVSRDLGFGPVKALDPAERGAGDISFVAPLIDGLDGLGGAGAGAHAPGEWIDLETFARQIQRAAVLIDRLTHDEAP